MTGGRPDSHRDDTLHELLRSPLETETPRRRAAPLVAGAAFLAAAAAIALPVWLLTGDGVSPDPAAESSGQAPATSAAAPFPGTPGYPSDRYLATAVAAGPGTVVMIGGVEGGGHVLIGSGMAETWTYSTEDDAWYLSEPGGGPQGRFGQAVAYDSRSGVVVMFGGGTGAGRWCRLVRRCASGESGETWWFDPTTGTWRRAPGEDGPPARVGANAAYDAGSDRIVVFGGVRALDGDNVEMFADTWAYDVDTDTWTEMHPDATPPRRAYGAMTYDPGLDRILLWGGSGIDEEMDSTVWAYDVDGDEWAPLGAEGDRPDPAWDASFVYADVLGKSILVGGEGPLVREIAEGVTATEIGVNDRVWVFDAGAGAWSEREPFAPVAAHTAAYDGRSERMFLFVGDHTIAYDPVTDTWEDLTPSEE